ncbi:GNAT family N-acetyltransferase [Listeria swaminathanii]|uniref:GNAT family N-acetyltransferase n=1 Tax=Listeria swaminathanii TaxID=2713501 RepID=A0A7X0ZY40_9LIST|nr:GNAT family N-acetyltransferase [Listeria swaminathanii]MBC2328508.1 GNAT family N-acetyltransferase [Listeria swaminathanii]
MEIKHFANNPKHLAELVDLINYCQNIEADLDIKMAEQADIFEIEDYYQKQGGQFWIALHDNKIVGSIALLPFDKETVILKKFFTYPEFRGNPMRLGHNLFDAFYAFYTANDFSRIILDTPENEKRSHYFYEKQGFQQIAREALDIDYPFPDRNSRIYEQKKNRMK